MIARILFTHSRYLALFILSILMVGYTSFNNMARQEDPTITSFVASLQTFFPGASPARVESLITKPLEDAIREIPEITEVSSTSTSGVSVLKIELDYRLPPSEMDRVWSEVRDKTNDVAANFPAAAGAPELDDDLLRAYVKILSLSAEPGKDIPVSLLRREALTFADAAKRVDHTRGVRIWGLPDEEVTVALDEALLARSGITVGEVALAIRKADVRVPTGRLSGKDGSMTIELSGEFTDVESVRNIIVRSLPNGRIIKVADIASVEKSERQPLSRIAISNGERSVLIAVEMNKGFQVDRYSDIFDEFLEEYKSELPPYLTLETSYDQSVYTEARLWSVAKNLLVGIALVIAVLMLTLGWRASLVVALILPLCSLLSMIVLRYLEVPIHQMSVTGLVVALGLLVDGSIVMVDECRKRLLEGLKPIDAMTGAVSRLRIPLLSSTVTTVLAFLPMAILPGPAGNFLGAVATSVIVMLIASLVLALSITPVLAARIIPADLHESSHWWEGGMQSELIGRWFSRSLDWSMRNPIASVALALVLPITGFLSAPTLTNQFFPATDRDQFYIQITLPQGSDILETLSVVEALDDALHKEDLVRRVDWTVGESAPPFYYNLRSNKEGVPNWAEGLILTTDENKTDALIRRLQLEFDEAHPNAQIIVRGIDQGPPVEAPLEVEIKGPNIAILKALGEEMRLRIERLPDVTHTRTSMTPGGPKVLFDLDEAEVNRVGLGKASVASTINGALTGIVAGELLEDTERLPIRVRLIEEDWNRFSEIRNLRIPLPPAGDRALNAVPIGTLGDASLIPDRSPITRKDGQRNNKVQAYLTRGVLPEEALKLLQADLAQNPIDLPTGYSYSFGGDSDERAMVVNDLKAPMGMITAALIATILLTFNSWRLSAVAGIVTICSFGLSLLSLAVFHHPLGVTALIGVIGSIGVSINAAIIIITALQQNPGAMAGDVVSVREVVLDSSRHIVSTTITTFGGFLPLILEGSNFWPPFAMAIAGGVLLSTVVSFYLVPAMFYMFSTSSKATKAGPTSVATSEVSGV